MQRRFQPTLDACESRRLCSGAAPAPTPGPVYLPNTPPSTGIVDDVLNWWTPASGPSAPRSIVTAQATDAPMSPWADRVFFIFI